MKDFTFQWNIVSESLRNSIHDKGSHGYGGIWGGNNATYHHNLLAHHDSRNPRIDHDYVSTQKGPVSIFNNVIYNWGATPATAEKAPRNGNDLQEIQLREQLLQARSGHGLHTHIWLHQPTTSFNCSQDGRYQSCQGIST